MFRTVATEPPPHVNVDPPEQLVPLDVLQLSLAAPDAGWAAHLADRAIAITIDDIGRAAISRTEPGNCSPRSVSGRLRFVSMLLWWNGRLSRLTSSSVHR